jgi:hypothetical protein
MRVTIFAHLKIKPIKSWRINENFTFSKKIVATYAAQITKKREIEYPIPFLRSMKMFTADKKAKGIIQYPNMLRVL